MDQALRNLQREFETIRRSHQNDPTFKVLRYPETLRKKAVKYLEQNIGFVIWTKRLNCERFPWSKNSTDFVISMVFTTKTGG